MTEKVLLRAGMRQLTNAIAFGNRFRFCGACARRH
jgi:hypothetical protein